jgi:hypothetical protein
LEAHVSGDLLQGLGLVAPAPIIPDKARPRSVVDGKLLQVSVTQVKDFDDTEPEGCPRRWYYNKVEGLPKPQFDFQKRGIEMHEQYEHYFKTGQPVLGELAREGVRYQPSPGSDLLVEYEITLDCDGVRFLGYADLAHARNPLEPHLFDHKTTSGKQWAKDEAKLRKDVQAVVYSKDALLRWPTAERVRFQLTYHLTKGGRIGHKAWPVSVCLPVAEIEQKWLTVKQKVAEMKETAKAPSAEEVRAAENTEACRAYRGCPYQDRCSKAPHRRPDVDILDSLGIFDDAPSPAPAAPPAPPKAPSLIEDQSTIPDEVLKAQRAAAPTQVTGTAREYVEAVGRGDEVAKEKAIQKLESELDPRIIPGGVLPRTRQRATRTRRRYRRWPHPSPPRPRLLPPWRRRRPASPAP